MTTTLKFRKDDKVKAKVFILESIEQVEQLMLRAEETEHVKKNHDEDKEKTIVIDRYTESYYIFFIDGNEPETKFMETCRRKGATICKLLNANHYEDVLIQNFGDKRCVKMGTAEGMMLAILLMNLFAPLIDWCVIALNIRKRKKRWIKAERSAQ